jgi:hypothetical protein
MSDVYVGCAAPAVCCEYEFYFLSQIPWGSEILVGPIGHRSWVLPCLTSGNSIEITQQPQSQSINNPTGRESFTFAVICITHGFSGPLRYVWEHKVGASWLNVNVADTDYSNNTSITISNKLYRSPSIWLRCFIFSSEGNCAVLSNLAKLSILVNGVENQKKQILIQVQVQGPKICKFRHQ